jgi:hypothetical protein
MAVSPRLVALVGLLALGPVIVFALSKSVPLSGVVTAVNVVIIAASLWYFTGPAAADGRAH